MRFMFVLLLGLAYQVSVIDAQAQMTLGVSPNWVMSHEFTDASAFLGGKLQLQFLWDKNAAKAALPTGNDLRSIPTVTNFAGGAALVVDAGPIVTTGSQMAGSRFFVGSFKQELKEKCFPFDSVEAEFNILILRPFRQMIKMGLFCACDGASCGDECKAYKEDGTLITDMSSTEATKIVRSNTKGEAVGFDWEEFTCELDSGKQKLKCGMTGTRDPELILLSALLPGIVMIAVAFGSFWLPTGMAMPRVATVMFAMLTFIAKGTSVMSKAPDTGGLSWLAHFFVSGVFILAILLVGHVLTFALSGDILPVIQTTNKYIVFCAYVLFLGCDLASRNCKNVAGAWPIIIIILFLLGLFVSIGFCWKKHSETIKKTCGKKKKLDESEDGAAA